MYSCLKVNSITDLGQCLGFFVISVRLPKKSMGGKNGENRALRTLIKPEGCCDILNCTEIGIW